MRNYHVVDLGRSLSLREAFFDDYRAWVIARCRDAIRRVPLAIGAEANGLIESMLDGTGSADELERWSSIGPHAAVRRELVLSADAVDILLLVAAPQLWGVLPRIYERIDNGGRAAVNAQVLTRLLGGTPAAAAMVARELAHDAPLRKHAAIELRANGGLKASPAMVARLSFSLGRV
jgi:hypothetical protein